MQYFLGRYDYAMDDRGRVPLPVPYRPMFAEGVVINQGPDRCLRLFTKENFDQQAQLYTREDATEESGRMTRRSFFANCFSVELDRQGRVLVPGPLRSYARLEGNVVIAGVGEWLEIWNAQHFEERMQP